MHGIDPFSNDAPRHLSTSKVIEAETVSDIIQAPELRVSQYKAFIHDRPIKGTVSSILPIWKNKLNTGTKKKKRSHQAEDILIKDCQVFGTIIAKALTLDLVFQ